MRRRARASIVALFACAAASGIVAMNGCTIVNGLVADPPDGGVVVAEGGGNDAEAGPVGNGCSAPPPKPEIPDDGALEVVAVTKQLFLTPKPGSSPVGFDLDESCLLPSSDTCTSPQKVTDGKGGLDNRGADLFALVNDRTDLEERANKGITDGKNAFLVKVAKYNGKREDPLVEISLYSALGLLDGGNNVPPKFEETEAWTIDEDSFNDLGLPSIVAIGWVTGGKAYAFVPPETSLRLSNTFSVLLAGGVVQLDLDLAGTKPRITGGVIAGRWPVRDMLQTVSRQRLSDAGDSAICAPGQEVLLALARTQICGNVDIMSERTRDRQNALCDAVSVGFAFEMGAASLGGKMAFAPEDDCPGFDAGACEK